MPLFSILALIGLIIGLVLERKKLIGGTLLRRVSLALVQVIYPCLIFSSLLLRFEKSDLQSLWLLPLLVFCMLGAGLVFGLGTRALNGLRDEATMRSYVFLTIMPNYSFVPLVIAQTFFGDRAVAYVAVASIGADIFLWTLAYPQIAGRMEARRLLSPALVSVVLAILVQSFSITEGPIWQTTLEMMNELGKFTLPLSMFILGVQLARAPLRIPQSERRAHALVFLWRLILCPALLYLALFSLDIPREAKLILMISGAMPGAIITVVLSELHAADSRFAASSIFWGHLLAAATVSIWQWLAFLSF